MGNSFGADGMESIGHGIDAFGKKFEAGMKDASWNLKTGMEDGAKHISYGFEMVGTRVDNGAKHISYGFEKGVDNGAKRFENALSNASANLEHGMIGASFELSNGAVDSARQLKFGMINSAHELRYGVTEASRELSAGAERSAQELSHGVKAAAGELRSGMENLKEAADKLGSGMENFGHELRQGTVDATKLFSNNLHQSLFLLVKCVIVIAVLLVASNFLTIYLLTAETTSSFDPWTISQLIQNSEKIESKVEENHHMVIYSMCIFFGFFLIFHLIIMNGWNRKIRFLYEHLRMPTFTKPDDLAAAVAAVAIQAQNQHRFAKKRQVFAK